MAKGKNSLKIIVHILLGVSVLISSFFLWFSLAEIIKNPYAPILEISAYSQTLLCFTISLLTFLSTLLLCSVLIKVNLLRKAFVILFPLGTLLLPLNFTFILIVCIFLILALLYFDCRSQIDLHDHLTPRLFHIFNPHLSFLLLSFALVLAFLSFKTGVSNLPNLNITLPTSVVDQTFNLAQPFIDDKINTQLTDQQESLINQAFDHLETEMPYLKQLSIEDKIQLLSGVISPNLRQSLIDQGFSASQIDQITDRLRANLPEDVSEIFTLEEDLGQNLVDQIKKEAVLQINRFLQDKKSFAPWVISSFVFFLFYYLGIVLRLFAISLATLILQIFVWIGWVEKVSSPATQISYRIRHD